MVTRGEAVMAAQAQGPHPHCVGVGDRQRRLCSLPAERRPASTWWCCLWNRRGPAEALPVGQGRGATGGATLPVRVPRREAPPARQAT